MSKLILAAKDGFLDSLTLSIAIPAAIFAAISRVIKSFLNISKNAAKR